MTEQSLGRFKVRAHDGVSPNGPPTSPRYDEGNRQYILTLPPGT
jgi:hypothetical protein